MTKEEKELECKRLEISKSIDELVLTIAKLQKENAELKLKFEALDDDVPWNEIKDKSEVIGKLTEAKEIIKKFLHVIKNEDSDYTFALKSSHSVIVEAEQFLSEVEK